MKIHKDIKLGTIYFSSLTDSEIIEFITASLSQSQKITIAHANAHFVVESEKNTQFQEAINKYTLVQPDGIGVHIVAKKLYAHYRLKKNVQTGTDFYYRLFDYINEKKLSIYLLGSSEGTIQEMSRFIAQRYKNAVVVGAHHGYFDSNNSSIVDAINASMPDILFVGMGVPRQELWLQGNIESLNVPVSISVGAGLEFISQSRRRAPYLLRKVGLEWLYRFLSEPKRLWKRYFLGIPAFIMIILRKNLIK